MTRIRRERPIAEPKRHFEQDNEQHPATADSTLSPFPPADTQPDTDRSSTSDTNNGSLPPHHPPERCDLTRACPPHGVAYPGPVQPTRPTLTYELLYGRSGRDGSDPEILRFGAGPCRLPVCTFTEPAEASLS